MKKIILLGLLITTTQLVFSQNSEIPGPVAKKAKTNTFELQGKGSINATFLLNKNVSNAGDEQDYAAAMGFNYGLGFNAYFGNVGFGIEALMGNHKGGYAGKYETKDSSGTILSSVDYKSNVNLKTISIPILFKAKSDDGGYFEIGPQYNMVMSSKYKFAATDSNSVADVTSSYATSHISAVIGFGFKIKFGDSPLSMNAGLRLQYSFTDLKGVDGLEQNLNDPIIYPTKAATNAVSGGLMIALTYKLNKDK